MRINIIISKSKAGPRPVSALLSFSLPLPSLREARHALLLGVVSLLPLFFSLSLSSLFLAPSIGHTVLYTIDRLSSGYTSISPLRRWSTHTRVSRCVYAARYLEADRASSSEGRREIDRGSSMMTEEEEGIERKAGDFLKNIPNTREYSRSWLSTFLF